MKLTNSGKCKLYRLYAFIAYAIPMAMLFFVNYNAYKQEGGAVGFWGFVLLGFVFLAFKEQILTLFKKRMLMSLSGTLFIFAILMQFIADQIILITGVSFAAGLLSSFISVVGDVYAERSYRMVDGEKIKNTSPAIPDKQAWLEAYGWNFTREDEEPKE